MNVPLQRLGAGLRGTWSVSLSVSPCQWNEVSLSQKKTEANTASEHSQSETS